MESLNPFDLLGDDDSEDPNQLIAKVVPSIAKGAPQPQVPPPKTTSARLPSKPLPPSQSALFYIMMMAKMV
ncbi:hypothetical protein LIER_32866 [Lithospermum erythrorhizon]|uniref:STM1-like N-terminal domain-containing protein n=1 Tax=Lithospermum erythrorhizon TaxID=34254 RepID=A0AAV3RV17_LITER